MLINLTNFRCFRSKNLVLPDSGCILLNGPSGAGKTSIFKAINFVLYGKEQKCTTLGEKRCKVELKIRINDNEVSIVRTKCPNHLVYATNNTTLEDESAQNKINEVFGEHFFLTGYITQKNTESFFGLSKEEKTEFLQKLSIEQFDINDLRTRVKHKIRERKDILNSIASKLQYIKDVRQNLDEEIKEPVFPIKLIESEQHTLVLEDKNRTSNLRKLAELRAQLEQLQDHLIKAVDINNLVKQKETIEGRLIELKGNKKERNIIELEQQIKQSKELLEEWVMYKAFVKDQELMNNLLNQHNEKYTGELEKYNKIFSDTKTELSKISQAGSLQDEFETLNKIQSLIESCPYDLDCSLDSITPNLEDILNELQDELVSLIDTRLSTTLSLESNNAKLTNLKNQLQTVKDMLKGTTFNCPDCSSSLYLNGNKLEKRDNTVLKNKQALLEVEFSLVTESITSSKSELDTLNDTINSKRTEKRDIDTFLKKWKETNIDNYKNLETACITSTLQQIKKSIKTVDRLQSTLQDAQNIIQHAETQLKTGPVDNVYKGLIKRLANDISQPEQSEALILETLKSLDNEYTEVVLLNRQIKDLEEQLDDKLDKITDAIDVNVIQSQIESTKESIAQRTSKAETFNKRERLIATYLVEKEKYNNALKIQTDYNTLTLEEKVASRALTVAETVLRKIAESEMESLLNTITVINAELEDYIDQFFDQELDVKLVIEKENSKGEKKGGKVDLVITRNNEEIPIDVLSGGEWDRVALALFLAFNSLSKCKLILLDECLASLHSELVEKIVECVKERNPDKLVLVTLHQANTGLFDEVIDL
jgi:exonuclease SbcC